MTDDEVLVKVEGVSKKFAKNFKRSLWYGVVDIFRDLLGLPHQSHLRKSEFWAVREVSFELRKGQCLGLIGHNGAGKSTLLKMLNGLIKPDKGSITLVGKVGALIELSAGFNPILTGRENVFNYGIILGFTHQEILKKYKDIVAFAEMEDFMETPVQNYSSGMKVRLGFAVAAQMEPDVLIIDEVLAVGDAKFRAKCFNTIQEMLPNTAVIFVSHSMAQVARISNHILLLSNGSIQYMGNDMQEGVLGYLGNNRLSTNKLQSKHGINILSAKAIITDHIIKFELEIKIEIENLNELKGTFIVHNLELHPIYTTHFAIENDQLSTGNKFKIISESKNLLTNGVYTVDTILSIPDSRNVSHQISFVKVFDFIIENRSTKKFVEIELEAKNCI